jgi:hypothetical protein
MIGMGKLHAGKVGVPCGALDGVTYTNKDKFEYDRLASSRKARDALCSRMGLTRRNMPHPAELMRQARASARTARAPTPRLLGESAAYLARTHARADFVAGSMPPIESGFAASRKTGFVAKADRPQPYHNRPATAPPTPLSNDCAWNRVDKWRLSSQQVGECHHPRAKARLTNKPKTNHFTLTFADSSTGKLAMFRKPMFETELPKSSFHAGGKAPVGWTDPYAYASA